MTTSPCKTYSPLHSDDVCCLKREHKGPHYSFGQAYGAPHFFDGGNGWEAELPEEPLDKGQLALMDVGLTEQEVRAFYHLADSAKLMLALPTIHPMEREETCHDFHKLQSRLMARAGLRAIGWPERTCDTCSHSPEQGHTWYGWSGNEPCDKCHELSNWESKDD